MIQREFAGWAIRRAGGERRLGSPIEGVCRRFRIRPGHLGRGKRKVPYRGGLLRRRMMGVESLRHQHRKGVKAGDPAAMSVKPFGHAQESFRQQYGGATDENHVAIESNGDPIVVFLSSGFQSWVTRIPSVWPDQDRARPVGKFRNGQGGDQAPAEAVADSTGVNVKRSPDSSQSICTTVPRGIDPSSTAVAIGFASRF